MRVVELWWSWLGTHTTLTPKKYYILSSSEYSGIAVVHNIVDPVKI